MDALRPDELICPPCAKKIRRVSAPVCYRCGKPMNDETREYCENCEKRMPSFRQGIAWAEYASFYVRRMMSEAKYHSNCQILDYPCKDFAARNRERIALWHAEALIPVPVHEKKYRERGYNQAEEIANRLSIYLGIPVDSTLLVRKENTKAQKTLSETQRFENLLRAFDATRPSPYRTVILVDDIYTTGSTAECCTRALMKAGAETVYFMALAIGRDTRVTV